MAPCIYYFVKTLAQCSQVQMEEKGPPTNIERIEREAQTAAVAAACIVFTHAKHQPIIKY